MTAAAFSLTIGLDNDAMTTTWDVADALRTQVVPALGNDQTTGTIRDANGNTVGAWSMPDADL